MNVPSFISLLNALASGMVVLLAAEGETSSVCAQLADADARVAGRPFIRQLLHQRPSSDESASSSSYQL